jgi:hypothetical protein
LVQHPKQPLANYAASGMKTHAVKQVTQTEAMSYEKLNLPYARR